ncbi:hypothetical protein ACFPPE_07480 [Agromyces tardus]|uniref:hypothetical protein n=1 Tax=Agromyces tardus TaxID=2583849 RepID=UPI003620B782
MSDWERLGRYVRDRREVLNLTQADVQDFGGPSPALLRGLENNRVLKLGPNKRRDLERALLWEPSSFDRVLAGGEPIPSVPTEDAIDLVARRKLEASRSTTALPRPAQEPASYTVPIHAQVVPMPLVLDLLRTAGDADRAIREVGERGSQEAEDVRGLVEAAQSLRTAAKHVVESWFGGEGAMRDFVHSLNSLLGDEPIGPDGVRVNINTKPGGVTD